jgi:signal transduction histidine kinase
MDADRGGGGVRVGATLGRAAAIGRALARRAPAAGRALARDLSPAAAGPVPPLPGARPALRWLPHAAVLAGAVALGAVTAGEATRPPADVPVGLAVALGLAQGLPLALAPVAPVAALWASLGAGTLVSEVLRAGGDGPVWAEPSLLVHLGVLGLLGLRVRPRVLPAGWLLTLLAGVVLVQRMPGLDAAADLGEPTLLSAVVLVAAGAVRARGDAQRRLADSERAAREERARRAVLEERARIARELHDVVAHHMSVVAIQAEAAPYRVADPPAELVRALGTIRASAVQALGELHRVLGLLRSAGGDGTGTLPLPGLDRLDELVGAAREVGHPVTVTVHGERRPLPPGVDLSAYRIAQEALSNVLRHAPGAAVEVTVDRRPAGVEVAVVNGPGTAAAAGAAGAGQGLVGMRERVAMLGGKLAAGPDGRGGYAVRAWLPAGTPAAADARSEADR